MTDGREHRRRLIRELLEREDLEAIALSRPANFAWYTGGADNRVDHSSPFGVAEVVVTAEEEFVLTSEIEADRFRVEQTPDISVVAYPWYEPAPSIAAGKVGTDDASRGPVDLTGAIQRLRLVLEPATVERYHHVGQDAMTAMDEALAGLPPGVSEWDVMAAIEAAARRRGLHSPVVLVAGDDRIARYRHPVTGNGHCDRRVMAVLCAERGGLFANLTRFVHFDEPDADFLHRQEICAAILAQLREEATCEGRTLAEAFVDCLRYYAEFGYPEEWRLHHQGGLTGYASREVIATIHTEQEIQVGQAFAWNPSITGAKAEETFVLTEHGPRVIAR